jgi:hypothetical protein
MSRRSRSYQSEPDGPPNKIQMKKCECRMQKFRQTGAAGRAGSPLPAVSWNERARIYHDGAHGVTRPTLRHDPNRPCGTLTRWARDGKAPEGWRSPRRWRAGDDRRLSRVSSKRPQFFKMATDLRWKNLRLCSDKFAYVRICSLNGKKFLCAALHSLHLCVQRGPILNAETQRTQRFAELEIAIAVCTATFIPVRSADR